MAMKSLYLAGFLAATTLSQAQDSSLLDRVVSHPGSYGQVCDVMSAPQDIPYRAFQITDFAGAAFSKANLEEVAKNREILVKAIRARLLEVDFTREPKQPSEDPKPEENNDGEAYGCDPKSLNPLILNLIQELHAIETLPELLVVEAKLVKGIAMTKDDAKAPPPVVDGWFVAAENTNYDEPEAKRERKRKLFNARVAQRDLVMLMALLMREKNFEPYLKSGIEIAYAKGLKAEARKSGVDHLKPGDPLPLELGNATFDPITKVLVPKYQSVAIPYSRESRDEIRAAAEKWITGHP